MTKVTQFVAVGLLVALVAAAAEARSATVSARAWWWIPAFAEWSLTLSEGPGSEAGCVGVGAKGFPLKAAASVSPDGRLGYGVNWGLDATQVPKFRRFRCLIKTPAAGGRLRWRVVDLVPRGRQPGQRSVTPVAAGIGLSAKR